MKKVTQILLVIAALFSAIALIVFSVVKEEKPESYQYDLNGKKIKVPFPRGSAESANFIKQKKNELKDEKIIEDEAITS